MTKHTTEGGKLQLIVNGKPFEKKQYEPIVAITKYLDSLLYGRAVTNDRLSKEFKYKSSDSVSLLFRKHNLRELMEKYRFKESYHLTLWASQKTIADIKNGKIQL